MARSLWGTLLIAIVVGTGCTRQQRPNVVLVVIDTLTPGSCERFGSHARNDPAARCSDSRRSRFRARHQRVVADGSSHRQPSCGALPLGDFGSVLRRKKLVRRRASVSEVGPYVDSSLSLLPEKLRADGYDTAAVVANPWVRDEFGFGQGFDRFIALDCGDLCDGKDVVDEHSVS